ncbi:acyl carrier protein [Tessaracoccus rhinocerotis]|uniref:Acyl carrier protein n=1 Tax=Tessaracoccus rhinocerotis TaxID=1689449 RepID=A0A553K1R7_9ACTN|nr:phosphopantetheine-binding protein [Tessaracoccus rhinocerotis]TRY18643.1 acyl carrier protein [Tessaracoccus rhinocerotis]
MDTQVTTTLRAFIEESYLFGDSSRMPADDESLLETGIIDSTGVLELIEFLEEEFGFSVEDTETVPENLGSISGLTRYVSSKRAQGAA